MEIRGRVVAIVLPEFIAIYRRILAEHYKLIAATKLFARLINITIRNSEITTSAETVRFGIAFHRPFKIIVAGTIRIHSHARRLNFDSSLFLRKRKIHSMKLNISTLVRQLWINSFAIYIYIYGNWGRRGGNRIQSPFVSLLFYREIGKFWMHAVGYMGIKRGSLPSVSLIPSHAANYHIYKTAVPYSIVEIGSETKRSVINF